MESLNRSGINVVVSPSPSLLSGLLLDADIQRQSVCELEVDAVAIDILNRHELQGMYAR